MDDPSLRNRRPISVAIAQIHLSHYLDHGHGHVVRTHVVRAMLRSHQVLSVEMEIEKEVRFVIMEPLIIIVRYEHVRQIVVELYQLLEVSSPQMPLQHVCQSAEATIRSNTIPRLILKVDSYKTTNDL